jgi:diguanylate cyclase (GGDEF)-like protein
MNHSKKSSSEVRDSANPAADELKAKAHLEISPSNGCPHESIISSTTALTIKKANLEISAQEKIAELNAANEELSRQVAELTQHNLETVLLSKMNDFLQSSTNEAEAYSVISETAAQLFPEDSGGVFVLSASRDVLEAAVVWGALTPANLVFLPSECWAHRRGQSHLVLSHEQRCRHVANDGHMYVCLPLLAQGETLGVLHILDGAAKADEADEARMTEKCRLAKILADHIGLGIANLKLRITMRDLSIRDPLTGLFNRRYMEEALAQEQHRAKRNDTQMAVIMIDIDHFKVFNDTFGHDAGDAVLRELGAFFKKHVRGGDIACRYGGEEFILILSPSTAEGARQRAENIRENAALLSVRHSDRDLGAITLSLGVAIFSGQASGTAEVIKAADVALYQAKHSGRNQVVMFTPGTELKMLQRSS